MKTAQLRNLIRWLHLLGAAAIGTYVYAPWRELAWFTLLMQIIIIPSLSLTGLWLWKGHLMRQKKGTPSSHSINHQRHVSSHRQKDRPSEFRALKPGKL